MRRGRFVPWLLLALLVAAGAWLLRDVWLPAAPPDEPSSSETEPGDDPLRLIGRADGLRLATDAEGRARIRATPEDLSDLGDDDPPVEIVVLDDEGKPVPSARVVVTAKRLGTRFEPELKGPLVLGRRWLRAGAEVRVEVAVGADGKALPFRPLVLRLGDADATRVDLRLDRGRDLEVRVLDEGGAPLPDTSVHVANALPGDARALFWNTPTWATTDGDGRATFLRLPRIDLVVTAEGDVEAEPLARTEIAAGRTEATLTVRTGPAITGRVVDDSGRGVPDVTVRATGWEGGQAVEWRATTGPDGGFRIRRVPPGVEVRLAAESPEFGRFVSTSLEGIRAGRTDLVLVLEPAVEIRGQVVDATGNGLREWEVEATSLDDPALVSGADSGSSPEGGTFVVGGLRPGRYRVSAHGGTFGAGRSRPVEVTAPATGVRLVLERAPRIAGRAEGVRGARYDAWWTSPTSKASARLAPDGTFEIPNLKDEAGTLYVGSPTTNRCALLRDVRPGGPPIEVALVEGERVSGRVQVPEDAPAGLVYVVLAGEGFELWEEAETDGTFTVLGVPPGAYDVSLAVNEVRGPTLQRVRAGASGVVLAYSPPR